MKNINIVDILFVICLIMFIMVIGTCTYRVFFVKDEVECLGGHYELRYNNTLKKSMPTYICDSAKIIYK